MVCRADECFCRKEGQTLNQFISDYICQELDYMTEQFRNSSSLLLSILYFKMVLFKFYPDILIKTEEYKNRLNYSLIERFYTFWLADYVSTFINQRNKEIAVINSEEIFRLESMRDEMADIIKADVIKR